MLHRNLGHGLLDAHVNNAEIAAGHGRSGAHLTVAGGALSSFDRIIAEINQNARERRYSMKLQQKLDRALGCTQRFFLAPEGGVDQAEHDQWRAKVWLSLHEFFLLEVGFSESGSRFLVILCHSCDDAFHKRSIKPKNVVV